jgi:hypothetical protein
MNKILISALALVSLTAPRTIQAATSNGNDFALYLSEARSASEKASLFDDAEGRPHFFRYLKITTIEDNGSGPVRVVAIEPASLLNIDFTIEGSNSLRLIRENPASQPGDALAVTGKVDSVSKDGNTIILGSTIVRHKDRTERKAGKELIAEVDPDAVVYSFTEGPRPIMVKARDRDILEHKDRIKKEGGNEGWFKFLEEEIAKRAAKRKAEGARP